MNINSTTQTQYTQSAKKTATTKTALDYESIAASLSQQTEEKKESSKAYVKAQNETKERLTIQQEIEIKQQVAHSVNETKESPLATAIKESSQTKATGEMAEMEEKYKDIYTPMPEKFSKDIEDLQSALIRERYPDYLTFDEFAKKYLVPIEDASPEAQAKAKALQDAKMAESIKTEGPNQYNGGLPYVNANNA